MKSIKKSFALALLVAGGFAMSVAAPVSQHRAAGIALTYVSQQAGARADLAVSGVQKVNDGVYLVNFTPAGFALVSTDDNADPIIGYSTAGSLSPTLLPDNMRHIMGEVSDVVMKEAARGSLNNAWRRIENGSVVLSRAASEPVDPLIKVQWNQSSPYNQFCPGEGDRKAIVGCVAVALSQAMSVQRYPVKPQGVKTYVAPAYGQLTIDYDKESPYDWNAILAGSNGKKEVARLLYHAGMAVEMDYGPDGSGIPSSQPYRMSNALKTHFGYPSDVTYTWRSNYTGNWTQFLLNELYAGRAIVYNALDSKGGYGHSFNIDGYNGALFHVNWGWGGYGDGYFSIDALADKQMGMNYDTYHVACTGIGAANSPLRGISLPDLSVEENAPAGTAVSAVLVNGELPVDGMTVKVTGEYDGTGYTAVPFTYKNGQIVTTRALTLADGPYFVRIEVSYQGAKLTQGFDISVETHQGIARKTSVKYDRASQTFTIHTKYNAAYKVTTESGAVVASGTVTTLPEFTLQRSALSTGVNTLEITVGAETHSVKIKK